MKRSLLFIYFCGLTNVKATSCSQQREQPRHHFEPREIAAKSQQPPLRQPQPYQPYKEMDAGIVDIVARDEAEADFQLPTLSGHDRISNRRRRRAGYEKGKREGYHQRRGEHSLGAQRAVTVHYVQAGQQADLVQDMAIRHRFTIKQGAAFADATVRRLLGRSIRVGMVRGLEYGDEGQVTISTPNPDEENPPPQTTIWIAYDERGVRVCLFSK